MHVNRMLLLLVVLVGSPTALFAQPATTVAGTWERTGVVTSFSLEEQGAGLWMGPVWSLSEAKPLRAWLKRDDQGNYALAVERGALLPGLAGRLGLDGRQSSTDTHSPWGRVALQQRGALLVGELNGRWTLDHPAKDGPLGAPLSSSAPISSGTPIDSPALGRRRVTVLVTGFDRFPRPPNHPRWLQDRRPPSERIPEVNPSGWGVRHLDIARIDSALLAEVDVVLHKLTDVPVVYEEGARAITEAIARLRPDVVISFGVGSDRGADADVERTCENLMDDSHEFGLEEQGPFHLPSTWPPEADDRSLWSNDDKAWLYRYPDNAGVSYNGASIDPEGPTGLTSTLPVERIVARVQSEGLQAIDGGGGPGRYICNNVMFRVIQAQTERGGIGGFIHLPSWRESRQEQFLNVMAFAIEESVRAVVERDQDQGLPGSLSVAD